MFLDPNKSLRISFNWLFRHHLRDRYVFDDIPPSCVTRLGFQHRNENSWHILVEVKLVYTPKAKWYMNKTTKKRTSVIIWYIVTHTALVSVLNLALYLSNVHQLKVEWFKVKILDQFSRLRIRSMKMQCGFVSKERGKWKRWAYS